MFDEEGDGQAEGQSTPTSEDQSPPPIGTAPGSSEGEAREARANSVGAQSLLKPGIISKIAKGNNSWSAVSTINGLIVPQSTPTKSPNKNGAVPRSKSRTRRGKILD